MPAARLIMLLATALAGSPAAAAPPDDAPAPIHAGLDLRYRYEGVEQDGIGLPADANTLRLRVNLETRAFEGFSAFFELDHVAAIGALHYNDTRNGMTAYPVVADPEGTDLNQGWLQFAPAEHTKLRLGRQRLNLDNQRFVGSSDWRQNEQTLDAFRIETTAVRDLTLNYAYVDGVNRVFGPDAGTPAESFASASHLLNAKMDARAAGSFVAYAYLLDFDEAPQLSSRTLGVRWDLKRAVRERVSFAWTLEFARQRDGGDNPLAIDASYGLVEMHAQLAEADFFAGHERLSGVVGSMDPASSPAFQTPLATLHKWQGWADKFLSTPSGGIEDTFAGAVVRRGSWRAQAAWHDFKAEATDLHYGTELDVLLAFTVAKRVEVLLKFADYSAEEAFTDTRKLWAQLSLTL